jgi:hypothetical protein
MECVAQQEQQQLRIAEEIDNIREKSYRCTQLSHKEIAEQRRKEMKVHVETLKKDQDQIMRRLREAEKKVDKADNKNAETVNETEMEMLLNFYMTLGAPSLSPLQGKTPGTSGAIWGRGQGSYTVTLPLPPPAGQHGNNNKPECTKKDYYIEFFHRAHRNLGGDTPVNRELANCVANQELEIETARPEQRLSPNHFQIVVKQPTRTELTEIGGELDSDLSTWKMGLEIHF